MNIEIIAISDGNFNFITSTPQADIIEQVENLPNVSIQLPIVEVVPDQIVETYVQPASPPAPKPVPLENHKSTGMGWFDGTSWGTTENKRGF